MSNSSWSEIHLRTGGGGGGKMPPHPTMPGPEVTFLRLKPNFQTAPSFKQGRYC